MATQFKAPDVMLVFCKAGFVVATHTESQGIDPVLAYGEGTTTMPMDPTWVLERVGEPAPPDGQTDIRPIKCPY